MQIDDRTLSLGARAPLGRLASSLVWLGLAAVPLASLILLYWRAESTSGDSGLRVLVTVAAGVFGLISLVLLMLALNVVAAKRRARVLSNRFENLPLVHSGASVEFRNKVPRILRLRREPGTMVPFITFELIASADGLSFWSGLFQPSVFFEIPWSEVKELRLERSREPAGAYVSLVVELEVNGTSIELPVRIDSPSNRVVGDKNLQRVRSTARHIAELAR